MGVEGPPPNKRRRGTLPSAGNPKQEKAALRGSDLTPVNPLFEAVRSRSLYQEKYQLKEALEDPEEKKHLIKTTMDRQRETEMDDLKRTHQELQQEEASNSQALEQLQMDLAELKGKLDVSRQKQQSLKEESEEKTREIREIQDHFQLFRRNLETVLSKISDGDHKQQLENLLRMASEGTSEAETLDPYGASSSGSS